jgi:hypothetical protein
MLCEEGAVSGQCRYCENCSLYNVHSLVCNELEGFAYASRFGGCYRDLAKYGKESRYWRETVKEFQPDRQPVLSSLS